MRAVTRVVGRLGKDPEGSKTKGGKDSAKFSVATKTRQKGEDGKYITEWYNVQTFGFGANYVLQYCGKGSIVDVSGELRSWTSEKYGKQYTLVADSVDGISTERPQVKGAQQSQPFVEDDLPF